jgi:flagellar hook-associated protein 1
MTSLSSALSTALSGLLVTSGQSAVVSRNVTRAGDANYSRRHVDLTLARDGSAQLSRYSRSADEGVRDRVLQTASQLGYSQVLSDALNTLSTIVGDPDSNASVAAGLHDLQQSIRNHQNSPATKTFASAAVSSARSLVGKLNAASTEISNVRSEAQTGVQTSVHTINRVLAEIQQVDVSIRNGRPGSESYLDGLDRRDALLHSLSQEIGVRTVNKSDGGLAIYTDSGIALFDEVARKVEMAVGGPLVPGVKGPAVLVDGVQISGGSSVMTASQGKLLSHLKIRDDTTLRYGAQLDEIARSLIAQFAETDPSANPTLPPATGLFSYSGSPAVPASGLLIPGLAGDIKLNVIFDDQKGGNPIFLRDGGGNGAAYSANPTAQSGFQKRLSDLADGFEVPFAFSVAAQLSLPASINTFAEASASSLATEKATSTDSLDEARANNQRWLEASLRVTGVNLDEEMASLLTLEKSYQASAKVMTTVDQMFAVLVGIVR